MQGTSIHTRNVYWVFLPQAKMCQVQKRASHDFGAEKLKSF
jgi:hypothetical protein